MSDPATPNEPVAAAPAPAAPASASASGPQADEQAWAPAPVGFWTAVRYWLKLGCISFGGPAGQIALMHQELVERRRWISDRRFLHALNYCMVLPGPEAQQLATYLGWLMHGVKGGLAAGILFVLPSLFLLMLLSGLYMALGHTQTVESLLYGIRPAVTALVLFAAWRIGTRVLRNSLLAAIALSAFLLLVVGGVAFPVIILGAGLVGWMVAKGRPDLVSITESQASARHYGAALIDDDTPTPGHMSFSRRRLLSVLITSAAVWICVMLMLLMAFGLEGLPVQLGWFFTKAALLTFGGAYAVLPYVYQAAVDTHQWLTPQQMIDGLALGETTPGPLIMVVAHVGFVAGWAGELFGPDMQVAAGVLGAGIATLFTFLPSFVFILAGAPLIEATRETPRLTAPLTAVTAAVVGVILNLAVFFGYHTFWPEGLSGHFEWPALLIALLALIALWRFKLQTLWVVLLCAGLGLIVGRLVL